MNLHPPQQSPLSVIPLLRKSQALDADEHADNLSGWEQIYDQLSPGAFSGSITELWLPKTQVFVETANQTLRQSCAAWPDSIWFGIPAPSSGLMSLGGKAIPAEAVCIRQNGADFDLLTAPDFNLFGIVVERESFGNHLQTVERHDLDSLLGRSDLLHLPLNLKTQVCADLSRILADAGCNPSVDAERLRERIFTTLVHMLTAAGQRSETPVQRSGITRQQRQRTVEQVRDYILNHPDTPLSVPQLCERFHLSRRALQYCFEDVTGLSPLAFMRAIRLNGVRRQLRNEPGPVGNAAYAWGFSHLSQFAQDYRKQFGELPSQTAYRRD